MKSFFSSADRVSHFFNKSGQSVSLASCGITPSFFWLAKIWSRIAFQPLSNRCRSLAFLIHSGVGWCGACVPPRGVVEEERHRRVDCIQLIDPVDGLVGHRGDQVPARFSDERADLRGVAEQERGPLAAIS